MNKKKLLLLLFALLFVFVIVYSPHFKHAYPFHLDEWIHISKAVRIREEGVSYFFHHSAWEIGFDLILLFISFFANLVLVYKFLPAINAVIIAIVLFCFMKNEFNYLVGLFSVIFLASLRSNVNILGLWFYVPIMGAIVFDYLCLFFLEKSVREKNPKDIYLVALFLFLIAFIHQSSFLIISLVVIIYFYFNRKFVLKNKKYFAPFLVLIIPSALMFSFLSDGLRDIPEFFNRFFWGSIAAQINYNPFLFYGVLLSLFAVIGYYFCYKKKKLLSFRIYVLISLINLLIFPSTNFTLFSAYQRYFYHFFIACVPLSAVGFYYLIIFVKKYLKKYGKLVALGAIILIILASIAVIFSGYSKLHPRAKIYISIYPDEYEALQSLRDYPEGRVLSLLRLGPTIKAISGHEDVFSYFDFMRGNDLNAFYAADCELKKEFLYNNYLIGEYIGYVHSKNAIDCSFLEEIYRNRGNYIYKVNLKRDKLVFINRTVIFDGRNEIKIYPSEDFKTYNFTFYTWIIKPEDDESFETIVKSFGGESKSGWSFSILSGYYSVTHQGKHYSGYYEQLVVSWADLKEQHQQYVVKLSDKNEWNFVALTYDGNFSTYINGELDKSIKADFIYDEKLSSPMLIGGWAPFHGKMKQIVLDNRSYSTKEIKRLYLKQKRELFG